MLGAGNAPRFPELIFLWDFLPGGYAQHDRFSVRAPATARMLRQAAAALRTKIFSKVELVTS